MIRIKETTNKYNTLWVVAHILQKQSFISKSHILKETFTKIFKIKDW